MEIEQIFELGMQALAGSSFENAEKVKILVAQRLSSAIYKCTCELAKSRAHIFAFLFFE